MKSPTIKEIKKYLELVDGKIKEIDAMEPKKEHEHADRDRKVAEARSMMTTAGVFALKFIVEHWEDKE